MTICKKWIFFTCAVVLSFVMLSGCAADKYEVIPIKESYEYTTKHKNYVYPSAADGWVEKDALKTAHSDGEFYCFTADIAESDDFINAQRTLLNYLRAHGMEIGQLEYYGTDYGFSFSESSESAVYVDVSSLGTWQQVLVTLQTLWGDYTDYGYVYALANAIASELGWQTDEVPDVDKKAMDIFFAENPEVINLLYPTFTTNFASKETVNYSKALSAKLFDKIKWHKVIAKPIETQLDEYYKLVDDYAKSISTEFTRQACGYAYYGENVKFRAMTTYAEFLVAADYSDKHDDLCDWYYFSDYKSIYGTVNALNAEMTEAVEQFGLEDEVGSVTIKWLDHESDAARKFIEISGAGGGVYYPGKNNIYISTIRSCLHEYYHHIQYALGLGADMERTWQMQVFCEFANANAQYEQHRMECIFTREGNCKEVFTMYTGREYSPGADDYFESLDIYIHSYDAYAASYNSYNMGISLCHYLAGIYGEREVYNLLLYPDTVKEITGKTWDELLSEREQYIRDKYAHVDRSALPEGW